MLDIGSDLCQPHVTCKVRLLIYSSQRTKLPNYKLKLSALQLFSVVEPLLYFYKCHVTPIPNIFTRTAMGLFWVSQNGVGEKKGECHRASTLLLLLLLITGPLPRNGGMAEDHGAPEAWQLSRA